MAARAQVDTTGVRRYPARTSAAITSTRQPLADGSEGTYQSLDAMAQAVRGEIGPDYSGYLDPYNISAARRICAQVRGEQTPQIAALFDYVAHHLHYVDHPPNEQVVQDCRRTLEIGSGDCVSKSVCLATLLACLGYHPRFVAQCVDGADFSHVYVEVKVGDGWYALDPVASSQPMGWTQKTLDGGFELPWSIFRE